VSNDTETRSGVTVSIKDTASLDLTNPIIDITNPILTLVGNPTLILTVGDTYTEEGANATDDIDGNLTSEITTLGTVDTSKVGTYTITYNVKDAAGNIADEVTRIVVVPDYDYRESGDSSVFMISNEGDVTAYNEVDGNITENIKVSGDVLDRTTEGTYKLRYVVKKSSLKSGYYTRLERTIYVKPQSNIFETWEIESTSSKVFLMYVKKIENDERIKLASFIQSRDISSSIQFDYKNDKYYFLWLRRTSNDDGFKRDNKLYFGKYDEEPIKIRELSERIEIYSIKEVDGVLYILTSDIHDGPAYIDSDHKIECLVFDGVNITRSIMTETKNLKYTIYDTPCGANGEFDPK